MEDTDMSDRPKEKDRVRMQSVDDDGINHRNNKKHKENHVTPTHEVGSGLEHHKVSESEAFVDSNEPNSPIRVRTGISYKDSLVGIIPGAYENAFFGNIMDDDGAVSSDEDEDSNSYDDGEVVIRFTRDLKQKIRAPWSTSLIVKGFFLIRFDSRTSFEEVLKGGPWFIGEHFLSLRPWTPNFRASAASVSSVAVWVRLPELPVEYYHKEALLHIGSGLGPVLRVDVNTANGTRGRFARICIQLDLEKPLARTVRVGKAKDSGHMPPEQSPPTKEEEDKTNGFGPWMLVSRRNRQKKPAVTTNLSAAESYDKWNDGLRANAMYYPAGSSDETRHEETHQHGPSITRRAAGSSEALERATVNNAALERAADKPGQLGPSPSWRIRLGNQFIRIDEDVIELIRKDPLHVWGWYDTEIARAWSEIAPAVQEEDPPLLTDMVWMQEISPFWNFLTDIPRINGIHCPQRIHCQPLRELRFVQFLEEVYCATLPVFEERKVMLSTPILFKWPGNRSALKLAQIAKCVALSTLRISCSELRGKGFLEYQFTSIVVQNNMWEMWPEKAWNSLEAEGTLFPPNNPPFMSSNEIGVNILTWNCRGVLNPCFRKALLDTLHINNPEILILTETRLGGDRAAELARSFPFDGFLCTNTIGFAGGIWILWKTEAVEVGHLCSTEQEIHASIKVRGSNSLWLISAIYGSPRRSERRILWENLKIIAGLNKLPWVMLGDFNDILLCEEKWGDANDVKKSLWSLKAFKAPGPDGLHPGFFQKCWNVGPQLVTQWLKRLDKYSLLDKDSLMPEYLNRTLISLIPKCLGPETLSQFRPISLCNTVYKIVTKIIVSRLRPIRQGNLVSPFQAAFVPGRRGLDNVVIAQELIHSIHRKKGRLGRLGQLILKLDLEKAYDRLEWDFIREVLTFFKFPPPFVDLVLDCVSTSSFSILVNGGQLENFKPSRGIRQGDPLSPYLFILCLEYLSLKILEACDNNSWKAIKASRSNGRSTRDFDFVVEKVQAKLSSWKAKLLSPAGRVILVQSVTSAIPAYYMQNVALPTRVCSTLDKLNRDFLWGSTEESKKMHMVSWGKICRPRDLGGLGLYSTKARNIALLAKLNWRAMEDPNSLWAKTLIAKPFRSLQSIVLMVHYGWEIGILVGVGSSNWKGPFGPWCMVLCPLGRILLEFYDVVEEVLNPSSWIWKVKTSPRIKFFLWQCYHLSVPVWEILASRGINIPTSCPRCLAPNESLIHMLRDCPDSIAFWSSFRFPSLGELSVGHVELSVIMVGDWVGGFSRAIGITTSVQAELRALKDGLNLAIDLGILNLEIEMDSLVAVELVNSITTPNAFLSTIVTDCRSLMERFERCSLKHIFREANGCADLLAKSGCDQSPDFIAFPNAPATMWCVSEIGAGIFSVTPFAAQQTGGHVVARGSNTVRAPGADPLHVGECPKYHCKSCGKEFRSKYARAGHLRIHRLHQKHSLTPRPTRESSTTRGQVNLIEPEENGALASPELDLNVPAAPETFLKFDLNMPPPEEDDGSAAYAY
uniref:C2H2-type domain-containing protein n=1 Tax=Fagus sylvatica TaxID=28930 RepID=A0A2N9IZP5_FAGSY